MDRYKFIKLKRDKEGRRFLRSAIYPPIPLQTSDRYIFTKVGDRLDSLAQKYYSSVGYWWIIAQANNIVGTLNVQPGTRIRIPRNFSKIYNDYEELNRKG